MKIEKRASGEGPVSTEETSPAQEEAPAPGKKPVVIYIMILFIAAFLLMALSFFMHQRSNTEALGELQNSVSAMQEIQATQDQVIRLQEELADAQEEMDALNEQLDAAAKDAEDVQDTIDALLGLYSLQQAYSARDLEACLAIIQEMEANDQPALLSDEAPRSGMTSPSQRYLQLKDAVEAATTD